MVPTTAKSANLFVHTAAWVRIAMGEEPLPRAQTGSVVHRLWPQALPAGRRDGPGLLISIDSAESLEASPKRARTDVADLLDATTTPDEGRSTTSSSSSSPAPNATASTGSGAITDSSRADGGSGRGRGGRGRGCGGGRGAAGRGLTALLRGADGGAMKAVEGFEVCGLKVAAGCRKKLPLTQSWCFVPLIFSALGRVPPWLRKEDTSTEEQIQEAQKIWSAVFSHWSVWRSELHQAIAAYGEARFEADFLPRPIGAGAKGWTTSLVYGEPRNFGKLPHPQGRCQDKILSLLPTDTQNQIFASVVALASSCSPSEGASAVVSAVQRDVGTAAGGAFFTGTPQQPLASA